MEAKMTEREWTNSIIELLQKRTGLGDNIYVATTENLPYAQDIRSYDLGYKAKDTEFVRVFESDLLIYELDEDSIKPRVIIETKLNNISTQDVIVSAYKAQTHKNSIPYVRCGYILGNTQDKPLPGRLFRYGTNFDFMICFKSYALSTDEKADFLKLIKKEIAYSQELEEMIYDSRKKSSKQYYMLQKELKLKELK
jgi:hypothetical protein